MSTDPWARAGQRVVYGQRDGLYRVVRRRDGGARGFVYDLEHEESGDQVRSVVAWKCRVVPRPGKKKG